MTDSPNENEPPPWLTDWQRFCHEFRGARAMPLTEEQRQTAWKVFVDRLEQERLRNLFGPQKRSGHRLIAKLPLFPPKDAE